MARIRTIKPEFFLNEQVASLTPTARLFFVGLWTQADRAGRLEDRPLRLKAQLAPYDAIDVETLLAEIAAAGLIHRYRVAGQALLLIPTFSRHQHCHHKEPDSLLPAPEPGADLGQARGETPTSRVGREGKGREQEGNRKEILPARPARRTRRVPPEWVCTPAGTTYAEERGMCEAVRVEQLEAFRDWEFKDPHHDWDAAWRRWVRGWVDRRDRNGRASGPAVDPRTAGNVAAARAFARRSP